MTQTKQPRTRRHIHVTLPTPEWQRTKKVCIDQDERLSDLIRRLLIVELDRLDRVKKADRSA